MCQNFDRPHEECGVFGVYAEGEDVARLTYFGLFGLQHRGQESAGIAVSDGSVIRVHKDMGLVNQIFTESILAELRGHIAIGHNRYSTTGSSIVQNAQPIVCESKFGTIAIGHNGNLINAAELRSELEADGETFTSTSDTEIIAKLIARSDASSIEDAITETMHKISGAYSLVILTRDKLLGVRDPYGIRPLCIGRFNHQNYILSSETCALSLVGAKFVSEIEPGEIAIIDKSGLREVQAIPTRKHALCVFEFIYFARPDSMMYHKTLHLVRQRMGHELAQEHPAPDAQVVIPIPDTGTPAAIGYAAASRIQYGEGVIKNRYIHRTFIEPNQRMRDLGVRMKFNPVKETLAGKRVVMVEDSIVRATTTRPTVKMLRDAGAIAVHVRISSPPIKYPCFYGIDMAKQSELIAANMSVEEIRQHIGADSLGYLSIKGLVQAIGLRRDKFCLACFDGKYPIEIPHHIKVSKFAFEPEEEKKREHEIFAGRSAR
ncbi:MAG: amidophosphoribosyltransferase [Armatimonadota bacterium]|nr:amidophosphoribosyltransferase [Armatimonadota bacterium]